MAPQAQQPQTTPSPDGGLGASFDKAVSAPTGQKDDTGLAASFDAATGGGGASGSGDTPPQQGVLEEVAGGVMKSAAETVGGLANLTARAAEKILRMPKGSLQATETPVTPPSTAGSVGEAVGTVGQYFAGESALKALTAMTQLPEAAMVLAEKYPTLFKALSESKAATAAGKIAAGAGKGALIGGVQQGVAAAAGGAEKAKAGAEAGAEGGAIGGAAAEAIPEIPGLRKLGRGAVNRSLGALPKELKYANPANAIDREGIWKTAAGDWNEYLQARRAGATVDEAATRAGGRFGAVISKINELSPQLNTLLSQSDTQIPVAEAIDKPLQEEMNRIIDQTALDDTQKNRFVNKIARLEKSWHDNLGNKETLSPAELNKFKQDLGETMSGWGKNLRDMPDDNIQKTYVAVYEAAKDAVNKAVPDAAELNNRVSDLLAARNSLENLVQLQEGGLTQGVSGSTHSIWAPWGLIEREMGRILPMATGIGKPVMSTTLPALGAGYSRVMLSNGAIATVPTENLQRLQARDPRAQVLESGQEPSHAQPQQ